MSQREVHVRRREAEKHDVTDESQWGQERQHILYICGRMDLEKHQRCSAVGGNGPVLDDAKKCDKLFKPKNK